MPTRAGLGGEESPDLYGERDSTPDNRRFVRKKSAICKILVTYRRNPRAWGWVFGLVSGRRGRR
jgi:hypothetical protein